MIRFIDREEEIESLEKDARDDGAKLIILYGRRRVGKTRLILEFVKDKDHIFYIAEDTSKKIQIRELKEKIAEYFNDEFLMRVEMDDWRDLFDYLRKVVPRDKRVYLIIDEFSYIVKSSPDIVSILQKFWDTFASETQLFIILSGSLLGLMTEKVLSYASPLYGRRTRDIFLMPLNFKHSSEFLSNMNFEDKMKVYMSIGGIPEYLLRASKYKSADEFFQDEFFNKNGYFYREPYFILSQEFKEIKTYFTILNAIAHGNTRAVKIANFAGMKAREIYPYLDNLIRLGFVVREVPILGNKKSGIYMLKDPLFDFWFNFVYENREDIEKEIYRANKESLSKYFGKRFEYLVLNEIFPLFFKCTKIGKWWYRGTEIDIVAMNENTGEIWFGECKWKENVNASKIFDDLRSKAENIKWKMDERKEHYVIFAKSFKRKVEECVCIDLKDIEKIVS